jgi:hypothetical protein
MAYLAICAALAAGVLSSLLSPAWAGDKGHGKKDDKKPPTIFKIGHVTVIPDKKR